MKRKLLQAIAITIVAFASSLSSFSQEPTALTTIVVYIEPNKDNSELSAHFYKLLQKEFNSRRVFKIVGEDSQKNLVAIFAVAPINTNIEIKGYSASYNTVTRLGDDLRLDTLTITAPTLEEIARLAVDETLKLFEKRKNNETEVSGNTGRKA